MDEQNALEAINNYVHTADTHHAILLEGAWGCGKTRFVETALKARLKQDGWKVLRISAFGITSQSELFDRGIEALNVLHKASENRRFNRIKAILNTGANTFSSYLRSQLKALGISFSPSSELLFSALVGPKCLLVIDDIERRTTGSDNDLFGAINNLIESQQRKVLLVMGATKNGGLPDEVKEKLVGKTIYFEPSPSALVQDVLRDALSAYPHDIQPQETMASVLETTGCRNARALIKGPGAYRRHGPLFLLLPNRLGPLGKAIDCARRMGLYRQSGTG